VLIIAAMVAAVMFLSIPGTTMWSKVLQDSGHGPVFLVIGSALALMQKPRNGAGMRSFAILLRAFAIAVAIGVATELLQHFEPGRTVSAMDALHDAAGAALGLALLAVAERRRPAPGVAPTSPASGRGEGQVRALALAIAMAALTILAWQPLHAARAYAARAAAFPTLADGEMPSGDDFFFAGRRARLQRAPLPPRWARAGDPASLHLSFGRGLEPAFDLFEPSPDWRGYSTLAIDLTNPGPDPLKLMLRIHDSQHDWSYQDRFNAPVVLPAAVRTTVRISLAAVESAPAGRRMDLSRIANLMLFASGPAAGTEFYVSRIWLE